MKINSAVFLKSIAGTDKILYDGKLQVAFVGRSNVGKSSLINSLANVKNLAKSSSHPGKTKRLDIFLIQNKFYFVDLPGYGYTETNAKVQEDFRKRMLWYLMYSEIKNRLIVHIIDAKVGPTKFDFEMHDLLTESKLNFIIVANKIDKLKMGEKVKQLKNIKEAFPGFKIFPYSAKTSEGKKELEEYLLNL